MNLTIYTTFRSFEPPRINVIQRNAIQSWLRLEPRPEILVMGNDVGTKEACEEFGLTHVDVESNEFGTPILKKMMEKAEEIAAHDNILLVSGDIILLQDLIQSLKPLNDNLEMFCGIARKRNNLNINSAVSFNTNWQDFVQKDLQIGPPTSGDFFLYKRGFLSCLPEMPHFAIGRCRCDSWLIHHSFKAGIFVDLTEAVKDADLVITGEGKIVGTPAYLAPEAFASPTLDPRADIFSLGVVAYQAFLGELPPASTRSLLPVGFRRHPRRARRLP